MSFIPAAKTRFTLLALTLAGVLWATPEIASACSCIPKETLLETAQFEAKQRRRSSRPAPLTVVVGRVERHAEHGMDIEVLRVLANDREGTRRGSVLRVWGDPGYLCRRFANDFAVNGIYLWILRGVSPGSGLPSGPGEREGEFEIPACGVYSLPALRYEAGQAWFHGPIDRGNATVTADQVAELLRAQEAVE